LFAQQKANAEKSRQAGKRAFKIGEMLNSNLQSRIAVLVLADRNLGANTGNDRCCSHWVLLGCIRDSTKQR
jgi:hypothetical protein